MTESPVSFVSSGLRLEGLLAIPDNPSGAAVVCHPHPMYGGSMYNNVVEAILDALWQRSYATLRFNFRGVGASEGEHDGGIGELDDARGAAAWLIDRTASTAVALAGYSFGASVAIRAGIDDPRFDRVVAVALPVAMMRLDTAQAAQKPVAIISGDRDDYSPVGSLRTVVAKLGDRASLEIVPDADHFFAGYEPRVSEAVSSALGKS